MQGGVGDCTNEIAQELGALGNDVCVLTSFQARDDSIIRNSQFAIRPNVARWNWSCLFTIAQVCREFKPDVAHIQYQTGAFGMHPAINLAPRFLKSKTKFITTFHDLRVPYLFPKAGPVREWVTRELAQSCNAVVATNDEDYTTLETWQISQLDLIPIGSNIATTPPTNYDRAMWRKNLGVADDETLLCYFGFLNESKGGETLMRALAQIPNAKLLMIGGQVGASDPTNLAYLAKIKSLISDLELSNRVIWTNHVEQHVVTGHFLASDVCVMPYRDGASYRRGTLMAALAHGMPIITTGGRGQEFKVRKLPQLENEKNCLLIPPDDATAIAHAEARLMNSSDLRARIGAGARRLAQHFTWDKIAHHHVELYRRLGV
jgi:glycosyltransferase involved in cell wall biosynthesis